MGQAVRSIDYVACVSLLRQVPLFLLSARSSGVNILLGIGGLQAASYPYRDIFFGIKRGIRLAVF